MFDLTRQRLLDRIKLQYGGHKKPSDGMCAMEMVAYLAGEGHSYHPECACPVLTAYTIRLNDSMPTEWRQRLKPYLPLLIGTRDNHSVARAELLAWRAIREFAPIALEACGLHDSAARLRNVKGDLADAADAAYAAYPGPQIPAACRAAVVQAAHAAHGAHAAGAGRAAHLSRAIDASDAADAAIAAVRLSGSDDVWSLTLQVLDEAIAIGADERAPVEMEVATEDPDVETVTS